MSVATGDFTEAAIFGRVLRPDGTGLSSDLAEHILSLALDDADERRMDELLDASRARALSESERAELENLNHVADLLSLWHSKARRRLAGTPKGSA